jgi:23S rRNA (adenine2030-N6)-methyltransferase
LVILAAGIANAAKPSIISKIKDLGQTAGFSVTITPMLSYRHAFHAGNHADVLKHMTLIAILKYLTQKDAGITVVDTHAGAGLYRLDGEFAQKSAEADEGVRKLFVADIFAPKKPQAQQSIAQAATETIAPALQDYYDCIASFNAQTLKIYPGSPFVMHSQLRKGTGAEASGTRAAARDKLKLFELHAADATALDGNMAQLGAGRMISVERSDGFEALKALLPPPNKRAMVLIDPSYEMKSDYARVHAGVQDAMKRFPTGTYVVWYPIIPRAESHDLPRRLKVLAQQAKKSWLHATLNIGQDDAAPAAPVVKISPDGKPIPAKRPGLRESGMFVINPPHTLKASLNAALPQVLAVLGRGRGKGFAVESGG